MADWDLGILYWLEQYGHSAGLLMKQGQDSLLPNEVSVLCCSSTFAGGNSLIFLIGMLRNALSCSLKPLFDPRFAERDDFVL